MIIYDKIYLCQKQKWEGAKPIVIYDHIYLCKKVWAKPLVMYIIIYIPLQKSREGVKPICYIRSYIPLQKRCVGGGGANPTQPPVPTPM